MLESVREKLKGRDFAKIARNVVEKATRDCEIPFWQKEKVRLGEVVRRGIGSTVSLFPHTRYVIGEFRPPVYSVSDAWFQDWSNVSLDLAKSLFTRHQTGPEDVGTSKLNSVGDD